MSSPFNPHQGLILVDTEVTGPAGKVPALLALDTGATRTTISEAILLIAGYDPSLTPTRAQIITGSGVISVPLMPIMEIRALGHIRANILVQAHSLPPTATIDGLLGLDFFRGQTLTIDVRTGQITLT